VYRADLNPSGVDCRTWKRCALGPRCRGRPNRKAGQKDAALRRPKKPRPAVARRICPRRPGLAWQESMWNRLKLGKANDERHLSLSASRNCRPMERSENGHTLVLPSCPSGLRSVFMVPRFPSGNGSVRSRPTLDRLEPCEAESFTHGSKGGVSGLTARTYPVQAERTSV
jgi:hypothetical protein